MGQQWYYIRSGKRAGPISAAALQQLASSGQLLPSDLVWKEGLPTWTPAEKIQGLFAAAAYGAAPPVPPPPAQADAGTVIAVVGIVLGSLALVSSCIPFFGLLLGSSGAILSGIALSLRGGKAKAVTGLVLSVLAIVSSLIFPLVVDYLWEKELKNIGIIREKEPEKEKDEIPW
jgi:hypothetical protein